MMTGYSTPKMSVKDSFDDDEVSDDIEDEVFIRDGRKGFKLDEEIGVKRPLMAPRRKFKSPSYFAETSKRTYYRRYCAPYCYGLVAIGVILGSLMGATLFVNLFPSPLLYKLRIWSMENRMSLHSIVPCIDFTKDKVWHSTFNKLKSEAALVMVDLNHDNVDDVVVGFSTNIGLTSISGNCEEWSDATEVCGGGALALDGKTGKMIWRFWARQDILFVDCSANLNAESTKDCLISGKGGVLCTVDGKTGTLIWELTKSTILNIIDIYSAQYISDLDGDGFNDILMVHTSDQSDRAGHLIILSGRGGELIGQFHAPDKEGLFTAPRVMVTKDGSSSVIFATGAFDSPGAIYSVPLTSIAKSLPLVDSNLYKIWQGPLGVSSGFVLADMTGDGYDDIIVTTGSHLMVLNSDNFTIHWNVSSFRGADTTQKLQIAVGPTPAYYDDDYIPDLLVTHSVGSSFPTYYYSQTWVANGLNGEQLLMEPLISSSDMNAPGISISFTGKGNDMYLFWLSSCNVPASQMKSAYYFVKGSTMQDKTNADLCKLRFNQTLELQLLALNQHVEPPGFQLYSSTAYWDIEHNNSNVPTYQDVKRPAMEWSEGGSEPFNQVTIKRPSFLPFQPKTAGTDDTMDTFPQYSEMQGENSRNDLFPINVNLGDSALDYNVQESSMGGMKMNNALDGRNERRTLRSTKNEGPRTLPRASATATLAKPLGTSGIDIVFATHWETPAANVRIVTEKEDLCIKSRMEAAKVAAELNDFDVEVVEENAARECLPQYNDEDSDAGQLTIYRFNLNCQCSNLRAGEVCSTPLPFSHQSFAHRATEVYFKARH